MVAHPRKICFLNTTSAIGGGPEQMYQLVSNLDKSDWDPCVCIPNDGPYWDKYKKMQVPVFNLNFRKLSLITLWRLIKILGKSSPVLIHSHGKAAGLYGRFAGYFLNIPVVHTFHGFDPSVLGKISEKAMVWSERLLSFATTAYICVSKGEKEKVRKHVPCAINKTKVIYNGIDEKRWRKLFDQQMLSGSSKNLITIIAVARLHPGKGLDCLIKGFAKSAVYLEKRARLVIAGGAPQEHIKYEGYLKLLADSLGLGSSIQFLGYTQNIEEVYRDADLFVSCSQSEALPLAVVEAMAAGVLVICSNIPGHTDIVTNNINGLLVAWNDVENVASSIDKVLSMSKQEQNQWRKSAAEKICKDLSANNMLMQTYGLYARSIVEE